MLDFQNTGIAFRHRSDRDLRRSALLFTLLSHPWLVKLANGLLKFALALRIPVAWIVKPTVYKQFVGGVSITDCLPATHSLAHYGVFSILDYSVEGGHSEQQIRQTHEETLRTVVHAAADLNVPFAVFKPTAFGDLETLSKDFSPATSLESTAHQGLLQYVSRIDQLCAAARDADVPIMIDAEDSWYQDLVDAVVTLMMKRYNKEKAIVYNTLQMYRHDRLAHLSEAIRQAREQGYYYGVKFVRGAYMEKERARAARLGYPSPIYPDKMGTDQAFDEALKVAMNNLDIVSVFCGTHNEDSCYLLASLIAEKQLASNDIRICFSQLYGMSDHISFNLAHAGYRVAKYLPYGPVRHVMPYLFRRAEENTSIAGQTGRELRLVRQEIKRRKGK
ncbi:MAG TPA: proline dehydrogenase family protein [Bacteroidales bacterium]|nr:proline dehydrogenase family protein [Bacteroidales bacterium]HSA43630.1 proline dehydrogenase family protein [Bacteroidales bacterium]